MCLPWPPPVMPMSVSRASPGPFTTQPSTDSDMGVRMCCSRSSSACDRADHVEALARAARAGDDAHAAVADAERLQDLVADADFLLRLGRKRDADRVADPGPKQRADADRRLDRAADQAAGLGDAEVQRAVHRVGELRDRRRPRGTRRDAFTATL